MLETAGWERVTPGAKEAIEGKVHRLRLQGIEVVDRRQSNFTNDLAGVIHNADACVLDPDIQSSKMIHAALLLLMLEAVPTDLVSPSA
jgi:hypothetical protein